MGMAPELKPEDTPRELLLKQWGGISVVTGITPATIRYARGVLQVPWGAPPRDGPAQEQAEDFLQRAKHAYELVRNTFLAEYKAASTTRQRIGAFKRFARGEPHILADPLILSLLIRAQEEHNGSLVDGIMAATRPTKPRRGRNPKLV
jgi:hypothetical protein